MTFRKGKFPIPLLAMATLWTAPAYAADDMAFVPTGEVADAPAGFIEMCRVDQVLCRAGVKLPAQATGTQTANARTASAQPCAIPTTAMASPLIVGRPAFSSFLAPFQPFGEMMQAVWTASAPAADCSADARSLTVASATTDSLPTPIAESANAALGLSGLAGTASLGRESSKNEGARTRGSRTALSPSGQADQLLIRTINHQVNRQVVQMSDFDNVGEEEHWQRVGLVGHPAGDCEDIAIEKRMRLLDAGFPADRMFFAVVFRTGFGLHTILITRMEDGDYVLDSVSPHILRWSDTHYVWLRAQTPGDPMRWTRTGRAMVSPQYVHNAGTSAPQI